MSKLDDLIRAAKAEIEEPKTAVQEVLLAGELVEFQFTKLEGLDWRNLVAAFPMRKGAIRDQQIGYNFDLLPSQFPVTHIRMVDGEELVEVTDEQWSGVFDSLESPDLYNVSVALWGLHEWAPSQRVNDAKKALTKSSGKSPKR